MSTKKLSEEVLGWAFDSEEEYVQITPAGVSQLARDIGKLEDENESLRSDNESRARGNRELACLVERRARKLKHALEERDAALAARDAVRAEVEKLNHVAESKGYKYNGYTARELAAEHDAALAKLCKVRAYVGVEGIGLTAKGCAEVLDILDEQASVAAHGTPKVSDNADCGLPVSAYDVVKREVVLGCWHDERTTGEWIYGLDHSPASSNFTERARATVTFHVPKTKFTVGGALRAIVKKRGSDEQATWKA